ncbi:MAG TPA: sterol desaturase family protein [Acidimicrobiales bacterium]|jgi:sterol desaturase/sphingolipid hydroxylase (fatty acid hydroxylase superfamily)|nr:sterol desaturase family protein [Acidimicrobiales bacterium]
MTARIYLPACGVAAVAVALIAGGWLTGWGGASFAGSMQELHLVVVGPASVIVVGVILLTERLRPAQRRPLVARGHRQDVLYALLHGTLGVLLITALTLSFQELVKRAVPWIVLPRMAPVPHVAAIAVIFVAMDACNWSVHLANHRSRVLWRFHELHHSQEDMNVMTVFRTHPLIHVSYVLALVPGVILLADGSVSTTLLIVYGGIVAFAHSNTNLGFGPLGRIVVSPNFHRIHHRVEGAQDVNLGFALTIWDQLSHRAVFPTAETVRMDTGIPGRPLRVEQEGDHARHLAAFGAQLVGPFRPMPRPVDLPSVRGERRVDGAPVPAP